jgi:hypothetical protein
MAATFYVAVSALYVTSRSAAASGATSLLRTGPSARGNRVRQRRPRHRLRSRTPPAWRCHGGSRQPRTHRAGGLDGRRWASLMPAIAIRGDVGPGEQEPIRVLGDSGRQEIGSWQRPPAPADSVAHPSTHPARPRPSCAHARPTPPTYPQPYRRCPLRTRNACKHSAPGSVTNRPPASWAGHPCAGITGSDGLPAGIPGRFRVRDQCGMRGSRRSSGVKRWRFAGLLAGATGLEPATSGVTGRRSNQLNYAPVNGSF